MQIKNFLTKQKIWIIGTSIGGAGIMLCIAFSTNVGNPVLSSLFTNLASSAFAVIFTVTILSYFLERERGESLKEALEMGEDDLSFILAQIDTNMASLYGWDVHNELLLSADVKQIEFQIDQSVQKHLKSIRNKTSAIDKKELNEGLRDNLKVAKSSIDSLLTQFSFAFSNKQRISVIKLRKHLDEVIFAIDFALRMKSSISVNDRVIKMLDFMSQELENTRKHPENPNIR